MRHFARLDEAGRLAALTAMQFLEGRLSRRETVEWALTSSRGDLVKQAAVIELLSHHEGSSLKEPFLTAWRLIEESWKGSEQSWESETDLYDVQERLKAGDRSGVLIEMINSLVAPKIKVVKRNNVFLPIASSAGKKNPKLNELFHASLTSPRLVDLKVIQLGRINESAFLAHLVNTLDSNVQNGLDIARRIGWDGEHSLWRLGQLYRVEYSSRKESGILRDEDAHHEGIAPAVKLLLAVTKRLAKIDQASAIEVVQRWNLMTDPIHLRLWAAMSKDAAITTADAVSNKISLLPDGPFWNLGDFPEIAELRATRFNQLSKDSQLSIASRIRKGPPKLLNLKRALRGSFDRKRLYQSVMEFRRIDIAGGKLPPKLQAWTESNLVHFSELAVMDTIEYGMKRGGVAHWFKAEPNLVFDQLEGRDRLRELEASLSSTRKGWDDDPAESASAWMRTAGNAPRILTDLDSLTAGTENFPKVWDAFCWAHVPPEMNGSRSITPAERRQAIRVMSLLLALDTTVCEQAIEGVSYWLSNWNKVVVKSRLLSKLWTKFWPIGTHATNSVPESTEGIDLNLVASSNDNEPADLDTLNTPAGRLVDIFLGACPEVHKPAQAIFSRDTAIGRMAKLLITSAGRSGLIVRHRLIEHLNYFLKADRRWAEEHLVSPLGENDLASIALWRAIARRIQFQPTLSIIGESLAQRVTDQRLGRESRRSLLASLVVEAMSSYLDKREPAVEYFTIQQAIRSVEDEVRANAALIVQEFISETQRSDGTNGARTTEEIFYDAVLPFLKSVWPQEFSLITPGSSAAFARLPASVGGAFADAVDAVERFLVPFNCWSLHDFGFFDADASELILIEQKTLREAEALIRLLNATIGGHEGAIIPRELSQALDQILKISPEVANLPSFRRLSTLARKRSRF